MFVTAHNNGWNQNDITIPEDCVVLVAFNNVSVAVACWAQEHKEELKDGYIYIFYHVSATWVSHYDICDEIVTYIRTHIASEGMWGGAKYFFFFSSLPFPRNAPICTSIPGLLFAPPVLCEFKPAGSCLLLLTASSTQRMCVCVCVSNYSSTRLLNEGAWRNQALHRANTPKPGGEGLEAHLRAVWQDLRADGDKGQIHGDAQR